MIESDGVYVFDGAMGTRLYDKGVYINRSYDELNLTAPDLVREVHEEYVAAGADIIETNTFGATRHKLQPHGLEGKVRETANIAAAAREAGRCRMGTYCRRGVSGFICGRTIWAHLPDEADVQTAVSGGLIEGGVTPAFVLEIPTICRGAGDCRR